MNKRSNQNDLRYANRALVFLVAGLLVLIMALVAGYSAWQAGDSQVKSIMELLAIIGLLLSPAVEGAALVLGIIGRRHVRGQNAVAGAIFLLLLALLGFCLIFGPLLDHVKFIFVLGSPNNLRSCPPSQIPLLTVIGNSHANSTSR